MPNIPTEQLLQLLMAAQNGGMQSPVYEGLSQNPLGPMNIASLDREPDDFFGPIGNIIANIVPGLSTTGIDGSPTPIFKTNFRTKDSGQSAFAHAVARQNSYVRGRAALAQQDQMASAWGQMFGDGSAVQRMIDLKGGDGKYVMSDNQRETAHAVASFLGSPMGAKIAQPLLNSLLGYDRGVSANIMNANSFGMAAGIHARNGMTTDVYGRGAQNALEFDDRGMVNPNLGDRYARRQFHMIDPFSQDFTDTREAIASTATDAVQRVMYNGNVKKANMHGASEELVSSIISDAVQSGAMDRALRNSTMQLNSRGEAFAPGSYSDVVEERKRLTREIDSVSARKEEATERLEEARRRGDHGAAARIKEEIKGYDDQLTRLGQDVDTLGEAVKTAAEPLVDAVTGVVSSLKDFYGDETEAKRALDQLTGGEGSRDKAAAENVRRQLDELKILGMMGGIDPSVIGKHMSFVSGSMFKGSGLADGSAFSGQMGLHLENLFMRQAAQLAGDPREQKRMMDAQAGYARAAGQSEGKDFATLIEVARKNGSFEGRDEDLSRIIDMATNGSYEDFARAFEQLKKVLFGSVEQANRVISDPAQMAYLASGLNTEQSDRAAELFTRMHVAEVQRMGNEQGLTQRELRQRRALAGAGISTETLDNEVGEADYDSIVSELAAIGENPAEGETTGASVAAEMLDREFKTALERTGGEAALKTEERFSEAENNLRSRLGRGPTDEEMMQELGMSGEEFAQFQEQRRQAKRTAASNFRLKGYDSTLSRDDRDRVNEASATARYDALQEAELIGGGTIAASGFMQDIGAAGSDKGLTRSSLSEASQNIFSVMMNNADNLRTKDGGRLSAEDLTRKREEWDRLMRAGRYTEAAALIDSVTDNMDSTSSDWVKSQVRGVYRTTDQIATEKMSRMGGADAERYASLRSVLSSESASESDKESARSEMAEIERRTSREGDLIDEVSSIAGMGDKMRGMSRDDQLIYAKHWKELTAADTPEERKAEIREQMRTMEEAAASDAQSDASRLVEALQGGDVTKLMETFKNGNVTMEQFFDGIKKIIGAMGGVVMTSDDFSSAQLGNARSSSENRAQFLRTGTATMSQRFHLGEKGNASVEDYLRLLAGKDVDSKDVERYERYRRGAKGGNRDDYRSMLEMESSFLGQSKRDLRSRIARTSDKDEREKLEGELAAVESQEGGIKEALSGTSWRNRGSFADSVREATEERPSTSENAFRVTGETDIDKLCGRIDSLISTLEQQHADRQDG